MGDVHDSDLDARGRAECLVDPRGRPERRFTDMGTDRDTKRRPRGRRRMSQLYPVRVGELRPSQLLWAYGCGSLVDLPQVSVVVMGLDFWDPTRCIPIGEDRLLGAVRRVLGPQVTRLLGPPIRPDGNGPYNPFAPEARI